MVDNVIRRASGSNPAWLGKPLLLVPLCLVPLFVNDYVQFIVNTIVVYCIVAVALNIVLGYLGQLAFANAAFFGIGAYTAGLSMVHLGLPFVVAVPLAGIAGGLAGLLVGLPALRVRGYYLAIVTLAFVELMRWVWIHAEKVTFGSGGFDVPPISLFGMTLGGRGKYYVFLFVTVAVLWTTSLLLRSRYGRAFVAVRDNEAAAASLGIEVNRTKIIAFAWSGLVAGLAGALFAELNGRLSPDSFDISQMLMEFTIVMIGGPGSLAGSVIGAIIITALPNVLSNLPGLNEVAFSVLLIAVLFLIPKGIGGFLGTHLPMLRERLYRDDKDA